MQAYKKLNKMQAFSKIIVTVPMTSSFDIVRFKIRRTITRVFMAIEKITKLEQLSVIKMWHFIVKV